MRTLFTIFNALIVLDYLLIGVWFLGRMRMSWISSYSGRRRWKPVVASAAAAAFFFGCVHTHAHLLVLSYQDEANPSWYEWHTLLSHAAQAVGGLVFWVLATRFLQVNIFDRKTYEQNTDGEAEQRLHQLAMRAGLVR